MRETWWTVIRLGLIAGLLAVGCASILLTLAAGLLGLAGQLAFLRFHVPACEALAAFAGGALADYRAGADNLLARLRDR